MTFGRMNDVAAALACARAAEEASRASSVSLHRSAVAMHEDAHAAAVANVRRQLIALGDALAELWATEIVRRALTGESVPFEPSGSGEWLAKTILRAVPYSLGGRRLRGRVTGLAKRIADSTLAGLRPAERPKLSPPTVPSDDPYADDEEEREAEILATILREAERPFWLPSPELTVRLRDAARRDKTFAEQHPERRYWVRRAAVAEAEFARRAIRRFNPGDAEPVMAVRRDLSGALVRYPVWLPKTKDPATITEAEAALIWARGHDLRDGATALRHEPKPSPEVQK